MVPRTQGHGWEPQARLVGVANPDLRACHQDTRNTKKHFVRLRVFAPLWRDPAPLYPVFPRVSAFCYILEREARE